MRINNIDPTVSIIILNYKSASMVVEAIDSIIDKTQEVDYEIIVVDNNSEDDIEQRLKDNYNEFFGVGIELLKLPENRGVPMGNHSGSKIAKGRQVLFLNPDVIILNDAISILSKFLDSHPEAGGCGGNLYNAEMKPCLSHRLLDFGIKWELNELLNLKPEKLLRGKNRIFNYSDCPIGVAYITGADLLIPKNIYEAVGGYRREFFMYYEETDLCYRIRKAGYKIYNVPSAKIQHLEGATQTSDKVFNPDKLARVEHGRITYMRLNKSWIERKLMNGIYALNLWSRIMLLPKKSLQRKKKQFLLNLLLKNGE